MWVVEGNRPPSFLMNLVGGFKCRVLFFASSFSSSYNHLARSYGIVPFVPFVSLFSRSP